MFHKCNVCMHLCIYPGVTRCLSLFPYSSHSFVLTAPCFILLLFARLHFSQAILSALLSLPPCLCSSLSSLLLWLHPALHLFFEMTTWWTSFKRNPRRPMSFSKDRTVFSSVCALVNKAYLPLSDSAVESDLSQMTGRSNDVHFRNICLEAAAELQNERTKF